MTNYCPHKSIAPSRWLMTFALVVWSSLSYAQMRTEDIYDRGERCRDIPATGIIDPDAPVDSIGGKKERRQKRPMESYLFVDSVRNLNAFSWRHNPYNNNVVRVDIDTMLSGFNRDYIFFQNESIGNVYLGNLGGAVMPLNFFDRRQVSPFTFLDAYLYPRQRSVL